MQQIEPQLPGQTNLMFPPSVIDKSAPHMDQFWQYVFERQSIWHRRFVQKLPRPWTTDSVLQQYNFTNVYRELDRGTVFYVDEIMPMCTSFEQLVAATFAYRHFNRADTWDRCFKFPLFSPTGIDWHAIQKYLEEMEQEVGSVFTGAFMVTGSGVPPGTRKFRYVLEQVRRNVARAPYYAELFLNVPDPRAIHRELTRLEGIGPFLAYEIYSDLIYSGKTVVQEDDWANPGPGAQKGLRLIAPNRADFERQMYELRDSQNEHFARLQLPFEKVALKNPDQSVKWLSMRNIEHNLCEASKMFRGRTRNRFQPVSQEELYKNMPVM